MRLLLALLAVLAACSPATTLTSAPPTTVAAPTTTAVIAPTSTSATPTTADSLDTGDVDGFAVTTMSLDGRAMTVAVADDDILRARGLMGVEDLGELDGMLFAWPEAVQARFTMRNTLIPLDIGFFNPEGELIEVLQMVPCDDSECPGYGIDSPFRWALEAPAGALLDLTPGARLEM